MANTKVCAPRYFAKYLAPSQNICKPAKPSGRTFTLTTSQPQINTCYMYILTRTYLHTYTHVHTYIHTYIQIVFITKPRRASIWKFLSTNIFGCWQFLLQILGICLAENPFKRQADKTFFWIGKSKVLDMSNDASCLARLIGQASKMDIYRGICATGPLFQTEDSIHFGALSLPAGVF